jgi:hemerythrin
MKWIEAYATGIQRIDEQHKMIFQMTADYCAAFDEGTGERTYPTLLGNLETYCRGHFGVEERCMDEYRCPVAQRNKDAHAEMLKVLGGFQQRYSASGYLAADARALLDTVELWLANHICGIDVQLKQCVVDAVVDP